VETEFEAIPRAIEEGLFLGNADLNTWAWKRDSVNPERHEKIIK